MIRFGFILAAVLTAMVLLVAGVLASSLLLVYLAIGVAALAAVLLAIGAVTWRRELFGPAVPSGSGYAAPDMTAKLSPAHPVPADSATAQLSVPSVRAPDRAAREQAEQRHPQPPPQDGSDTTLVEGPPQPERPLPASGVQRTRRRQQAPGPQPGPGPRQTPDSQPAARPDAGRPPRPEPARPAAAARPEPATRADREAVPDPTGPHTVTLSTRSLSPGSRGPDAAPTGRLAPARPGSSDRDQPTAQLSKPALTPPPAGREAAGKGRPAAAPAGAQPAPARMQPARDDRQPPSAGAQPAPAGMQPARDDRQPPPASGKAAPELPASPQPAASAQPATAAAPQPRAARDRGAEVTIVPGIARYHRSDCILIRFLGPEDLQTMPLHEAEDSGCAPCKACRPEQEAPPA